MMKNFYDSYKLAFLLIILFIPKYKLNNIMNLHGKIFLNLFNGFFVLDLPTATPLPSSPDINDCM